MLCVFRLDGRVVVAPIELTDIQVIWWSEELSKNQYDGIIGLSQGAAMAALLVSMVSLYLVPDLF
jgi:hypothetical protein